MTWPKKKISASTDLWFNACELNKPVIYLLQFDYLNAVYNKVGNEKKKTNTIAEPRQKHPMMVNSFTVLGQQPANLVRDPRILNCSNNI